MRIRSESDRLNQGGGEASDGDKERSDREGTACTGSKTVGGYEAGDKTGKFGSTESRCDSSSSSPGAEQS